MRSFIVICTAIATFTAFPTTGRCQPQVSETAAPARHRITLGVRAGIALPQVSSEFGSAPLVRVDIGYLLPVAGGRIGLLTAVGYSAPSVSGTAQDDRLPTGSYSYEATQRQLTWDLGVQGWWKPWASRWNLGGAAGLHMTFLSTLSDGDAGGEPFGEHDERATETGLFAAARGAFRLGPGALVGEIGYVAASQELRTTGELTLSEITILAGYRLAFAL